MVNALLFPGQGSQEVGMGKELYGQLPQARAILDEACETAGYDLKDLMFHGPADRLTDTEYAQPAIYTCSAMYLEKARCDGLAFDYAAGHSLGEYSALYAAGVFSFSDGLRLVCRRGQAMSAGNGKGAMAAVLGLKEEELRPYLEGIPDVVMANLNTKTQIVVSGPVQGIDQVIRVFSGREDVTVKKLNVSAAFHSPQMKEAEEVMAEEIERIEFHEPKAFIVPNVTGKPTKDVREIKRNLLRQITGQVRWYDSILAMKDAGVEAFYEAGNGQVLRKMCRAITLHPRCRSV